MSEVRLDVERWPFNPTFAAKRLEDMVFHLVVANQVILYRPHAPYLVRDCFSQQRAPARLYIAAQCYDMIVCRNVNVKKCVIGPEGWRVAECFPYVGSQ